MMGLNPLYASIAQWEGISLVMRRLWVRILLEAPLDQ